MIDTKNPISIAIYSSVISFVFFVVLLYIIKPSWIQIKNNKNDTSISWILLTSYSITFSLVCAITALLCCTSKKSDTNIIQKINTNLFTSFL